MNFRERAISKLASDAQTLLWDGPMTSWDWRQRMYRIVLKSQSAWIYSARVHPTLKMLFRTKVIAKLRHVADTYYYLCEQVPPGVRVKDYATRVMFCDWLVDQDKPELAAAWRRTIVKEES